MKGTLIITGANGGLGADLVSQFLKSPYAKDHKGLFAVRNLISTDTLEKILADSSNADHHEIIALDLSTLNSVRTAAKNINHRVASGSITHIRAGVLNAALQHTRNMKSTDHGLEANFAVNYLSKFLFTNMLLKSMDPLTGRIVIVSSWTQYTPPGKDAEGDEYKAGMRRYGMSKRLMVMFMYELQRRLAGAKYSDISVLAVDPGAMICLVIPVSASNSFADSEIYEGKYWLVKGVARRFAIFYAGVIGFPSIVTTELSPNGNFRTTKKPAKDLLNASFEEGTLGKHPKAVYLNGSAKMEPSDEAREVIKQKQLWVESVKLSGLKEDETVLDLSF